MIDALKSPMSTKSPLSPSSAVALAACVLLLSGCAGMKAESEQPLTLPVTQADGSVRGDTRNERIASLWSAAEQSRQQNNDADALESLYQALEIDPKNALLWSRAAEIQLDNEQPAQAENMAMKSNMFAGENSSLLYRNWLIIEHSRDMRGDLLGVRSAHKRVQEFQYQ